MDQVIDTIKPFATYTALIGGALWLFIKFWGKAWIENRFAERLDAIEHEHERSMQRMRAKVEAVLSGAIQIQTIEFTVLPKVWKALHKASIQTGSFTTPFGAITNLDQFDEIRLLEFLADTKLRESEKKQIQNSKQKQKDYYDLTYWYQLHDTRIAVNKFRKVVDENSIFIDIELRKKLEKITILFNSILIKREFQGRTLNDKRGDDSWNIYIDQITPLTQIIASDIRLLLTSHGSDDRIQSEQSVTN